MLPWTRLAPILAFMISGHLTTIACGRLPVGHQIERTTSSINSESHSFVEPTGIFTQLSFLNFDPTSAEARRGLSYLYAGDVLSVKGGIPVALISSTSRGLENTRSNLNSVSTDTSPVIRQVENLGLRF